MRKPFLVCFIFLANLCGLIAQNPFEQDAVLKNIRSQLPEGWSGEAKDKKIIFSKADSVWIKHINPAPPSAKKMNADEKVASFKKEGKKVKSMLSYRYEPRWSADLIRKSEEQNKKIFTQVARLPAKYKIEALFDSLRSEKGGEFYTPKTEADRAQIKKYEEERSRLLKAVVQVPYLQTEKFSLFPDASSGFEDASTDVYPEQASFEWFKIQTIIGDLCRSKKP